MRYLFRRMSPDEPEALTATLARQTGTGIRLDAVDHLLVDVRQTMR